MRKIETSITKVGGFTGRRMVKDKLFKQVMTFGGLSVLIAISLIFFYLASVVVPLFTSAEMEVPRDVRLVPTQGEVVHLATEEQVEIGLRASSAASVTYFDLRDGRAVSHQTLALPEGVTTTSFAAGEAAQQAMAWGLSDGRMLLIAQNYEVKFKQNAEDAAKVVRIITPTVAYPLGKEPIVVDPRGAELVRLAIQHQGEETTAVALTADDRLVIARYSTRTNLITGETQVERTGAELPPPPGKIERLLLDVKQRALYVVYDARHIAYYDVTSLDQPRLVHSAPVWPEGEQVSAASLLSGGVSLVVGSERGRLAQWFLVRDADNVPRLTHVRDFKPMSAGITSIAAEHYRKGFLVGTDRGEIGLYYATSNRQLLTRSVGQSPVRVTAFAPRANAILFAAAMDRVNVARVENDYPEVSFSALWQKVWYESYPEPQYVWQSSAAVSDFEPKFSLAPLTFGSLKAAFYAMLVAIPLAVMGAIYTAYFMTPRMRGLVKPSIEIMEALPTVILGFLAGLWLAPFVDNNLAGTLLAIFSLPIGFILSAALWRLLPHGFTQRIGAGWEAAILIVPIILVIWLAIELGHPIEAAFFGGNMPLWVSNELGWTYEQRNSLVVGIAVGFAVVPTIFSIAEDAVFSVPRHLTSGSLALGATPWQTLWNVVLLTASPGIFSAIMVGLGRAVGETMIVLMATGNTAVMDLSIFTGFRTLSANIGVEMPEAAVGTTHYRLLFLSALVLFAFTFMVNTVAELVRQRLREKYSTL